MFSLHTLLIVAISLAASTATQAQQQQQKPPPAHQAPVRQQPVRPPPQMMQGIPGQMPARPGQMQAMRPGIVKGPSGALRPTRPAHVTFNPKHRVGRAGLRYNRQAFMFRRDHAIYRRAYYRGPGGDIFFYDEEVPADDSAIASIANLDALPECPADADDCQGFATEGQPMGPDPAVRAQAIQLVNAAAKDDEGATHSDENYDQKVPYAGLTISLSNSGKTGNAFMMAWSGGDTLEARGDFQSGSSDRACWFFNKSYEAQRQEYDRVIAALKILGARAAPLREGFFDITRVR